MRPIDAPCSPCAAYARLRGSGEAVGGDQPWLLESALRRNGVGRYSMVGADPYAVVRAFGDRIELDVRREVRAELPRVDSTGDVLDRMRALLPAPPQRLPPAARALPFLGGAVGFLGYELGTELAPVAAVALHARDDLALPDAVLLLVDRFALFDHVLRRGFAVALGFAGDAVEAERRADEAASGLAAGLRGLGVDPEPGEAAPIGIGPSEAPTPLATARGDFDEADYAKAVGDILDEIAAGNIYQANLTQRLAVACEADPFLLYRVLRRLNPAPFAACLELDDLAIVGSSPERFLRVDAAGRAESRPIKGTRPRNLDPGRDAELAEALVRSEKDRAENLMIVDLVRNDLGRVCETGSVAVPSLMAVERYASVWHLVSTVTGRLGEGCDAFDAVRATFPPGSMTGAPKVAAMRVIDRLEPIRRTAYAGALGYFDLRGGCDLSVTIRTLLLVEGQAYLHVGGGVVADSDPVGEHRESLDKARALLAALSALGEGG